MAKIIWRNSDLDRLKTRVRGIPKEFLDAVEPIVNRFAQEGADMMYDNIDRIDTEYMRGSVGHSDPVRTDTSVAAEFGWGVEGAAVEDYFSYQEGGFQHYISGENIPPMHALLGAFIKARENALHKIARLVRR